jgi:hypothetical protein
VGVSLLDGLKAADLSLEAFDGCALLSILGFEVVDGGGLAAKFVLKEILGLLAGGESGGKSGPKVSKMNCRFDGLARARGERPGTRSGSPVPPSTIPPSVGAAG